MMTNIIALYIPFAGDPLSHVHLSNNLICILPKHLQSFHCKQL